ncbi:hypothetical protein AMTRI_Chr03g142040 [Amborella trichopoda]
MNRRIKINFLGVLEFFLCCLNPLIILQLARNPSFCVILNVAGDFALHLAIVMLRIMRSFSFVVLISYYLLVKTRDIFLHFPHVIDHLEQKLCSFRLMGFLFKGINI